MAWPAPLSRASRRKRASRSSVGGQRTLIHEIAPRDTVGVSSIGDIRLTPDGKAYAYVYVRSLFSLYQVTGLK